MHEVRWSSAPLGWAEAYDAHAVRLTRMAVLLVGAADAHDLVADAVLRAVSARTWDRVERQGAYLTQTLVHLAHDRRRQSDRRARRELRAGRMAGPGADPIDVDRAVDVRAALSSLSEMQLSVVFLHYWEDLTLEQAAVQLGIGVGSARTHLDRAKRRLRSVLPGTEGDDR